MWKKTNFSWVMRPSYCLADSIGYFWCTANRTSSLWSVLGLRMFKIMYSWSVSTMFPWNMVKFSLKCTTLQARLTTILGHQWFYHHQTSVRNLMITWWCIMREMTTLASRQIMHFQRLFMHISQQSNCFKHMSCNIW